MRSVRVAFVPLLLLGVLASGCAAAVGENGAVEIYSKDAYEIYSHWPFDAREAVRRQKETAQRMGVPLVKEVVLREGVAIEFVLIPPGEFVMGGTREGEHPHHRVRISRPFYMARTELTVVVADAVEEAEVAARVPDMACVADWGQAQLFLRKLNRLFLGKEVFRFPSETEWEYACRAGSSSRYHFGDDPEQMPRYEWCKDTFEEHDPLGPQRVACRSPNAWGLHDMLGNLSEWVQDVCTTDAYSTKPVDEQDNHMQNRGAERRVIRGGNWALSAKNCAAGSRFCLEPRKDVFRFVGIRLCMEVEEAMRAARRFDDPAGDSPAPAGSAPAE